MPTIQQLVRKGRAELVDKSKSCAPDEHQGGERLHPGRGTQLARAQHRNGTWRSCERPAGCTLPHRTWYTRYRRCSESFATPLEIRR